MSNANYNKQTAAGYGSGKGSAPKARKGVKGEEAGSGAYKDSTVTWPGAPGATRPNFNKTGAPQVKTVVVSDGVLNGGQDHFTK